MGGYEDDPTIEDDAALWRRIPKHYILPDAETGVRISSAAFSDHPNGSPMSVFLAKIMAETKRGPEDALVGHEGYALAAITARLARDCQQGVARDPLTKERHGKDEPAHAVVFGRKSRPIRRKLAKGTTWVISRSNLRAKEG